MINQGKNKILIAPDSFKGSLSANDVIRIISEEARKFDFETLGIPLADGGEGSLVSLASVGQYIKKEIKVLNAYSEQEDSYYLISTDRKTAYIESALICGIEDFRTEELNIMKSSSYGVGEAIKDAVKEGVQTINIFLGGSATNDGGIGLLNALGYEFYDNEGRTLEPIAESLITINDIKLDEKIEEIKINIINDVDNPLLGPRGATYIYGKQKGASNEQLANLDAGMTIYADILDAMNKKSHAQVSGSGAAGGIAYALLSAYDAELISGSEFFTKHLNLESSIRKSDLVITGEGKVDEQTFFGKAISNVLQLTKKHKKDTLVVAGLIIPNSIPSESGIHSIQLHEEKNTLEYTMKNSEHILREKISSYFEEKKNG